MSNLACQLGTPGKRGPSVEELPPSDWPIGRSVGHFFDCWLVGGSSPLWAAGPVFHKKASWMWVWKGANKRCSFRPPLVFASVLASRSLPWDSALASLADGLQPVKWNKSCFLTKLFWSVFCRNKKQTTTDKQTNRRAAPPKLKMHCCSTRMERERWVTHTVTPRGHAVRGASPHALLPDILSNSRCRVKPWEGTDEESFWLEKKLTSW